MANAEDQGKTIALVIFVVAFLGCSVTTYVFYDKIAQAEQQANEAKGREKKAQDSLAQARENYLELRRRIVSEENIDDHTAAIELIDAQRQRPQLAKERLEGTAPWPGEPAYAAKNTYPNYRDALTYLHDALAANDQRIAALEQQKRDLEAKINQVEDEYEKLYSGARDGQTQKNQELSTETANLLAALKTREEGLDSIIARYNEKIQQLNLTKRQKQEQADRLNTIKKGLDEILAEKRFMLELQERLRFDGKDGTIVRLQNDGKMAEVDIGQADGLRTGLAFGIFGLDSGGNPHEIPKAFLEIVDVIGPHRARARITGEALSTPVLPGDVLASPLWSPGDREGVAYVGFIHLDKDGNPDNEAFRKLVEKSGGKIDAELRLKTLKEVGNINVRTGWLIVGETPDPATAKSEEERKVFEAIKQTEQKFRSLATDHGVRVSNVRNYLNYLSYNVPDTMQIPTAGGNRGDESSDSAVSGRFTSRTFRNR